MLKFNHGDLVHLIDDCGANKGYGIYVDLLAPGFRTESDKELDTFWHFKIVDVKGETKYLNTTLWSLIPADPDSCNT